MYRRGRFSIWKHACLLESTHKKKQQYIADIMPAFEHCWHYMVAKVGTTVYLIAAGNIKWYSHCIR